MFRDWALTAIRRAGGTKHRAEFHHSGIDRNGFSGVSRKDRFHQVHVSFDARRFRFGDTENGARENSANVRVDDGNALTERESGHGPRGVRPDTGQGLESVHVARHDSPELVPDSRRCHVKVERSARVTQFSPGTNDVGG